MFRYAIALTALSLALLLAPQAGRAETEGVKTYTTTAPYADVKQEVEDGILNAGLKIDYRGNIGAMLTRTGKDIGSTVEVYKHAEFYQFCSARLSRAAMEADPANMSICPYVVYLYEPAGQTGTVTVGYKRPTGAPGEASMKAIADVDAMLDEIVKTASGQ